MARRTKEDTEKTFHALLDAAIEVFSQNGVANTTLNQIAKAAGLTRGAVYWHFENKDAVIKALWERCARVQLENFLLSIQSLPEENALDHFIKILQGMLRRTFSEPALNQSLRIITSRMEFTNENSELQAYLKLQRENVYSSFRSSIELLQKRKALNESLSVDLVSIGLWVFITGLLRTHLEMDKNKIDIESQSDTLIELWVNALR